MLCVCLPFLLPVFFILNYTAHNSQALVGIAGWVCKSLPCVVSPNVPPYKLHLNFLWKPLQWSHYSQQIRYFWGVCACVCARVLILWWFLLFMCGLLWVPLIEAWQVFAHTQHKNVFQTTSSTLLPFSIYPDIRNCYYLPECVKSTARGFHKKLF